MRSWHLFKHGIVKGRTRALVRPPSLSFTIFSSFITGTGVWKHYIKYLQYSNAVNSDAAV